MKRVLAHGTFDIIHYGHVNYLERAKSFGDYLIVAVASDKVAKTYGKKPFFNENIRLRMISSFKVVDEVILREEVFSPQMIKDLDIDVFVTTNHHFDYLEEVCQVIHLERTKEISPTDIKKHLLEEK